MKKSVLDILDKIHLTLSEYSRPDYHVNELSLMGGVAGWALFNGLYFKHLKNYEFSESFVSDIEHLATFSDLMPNQTFCTGRAGVHWLFAYFNRIGLLSDEDFASVCSNEQLLFDECCSELDKGNYDFLHGALGIAHYLAYLPNDKTELIFGQIFAKIDLLFKQGNEEIIIPDFAHNTGPDFNSTNIGLSHGIASILKFCTDCYELGIMRADAKRIAFKIAEFLVDNINSDTSISFFPNNITTDTGWPRHSRLAWCYGDLSIGLVLWQFSKVFGEKKTQELALNALVHSTRRRSVEETWVVDAGVCHGSAGIAHIFNRLWKLTGDDCFKQSCEYWIARTIEYADIDNERISFKSFDPVSGKYAYNRTFLEGLTGIGLVLLAYVTDDFSWDHCLMLNA